MVEKQQKSRYEYYRGYVYYTIDIEHTFASVKLTEAGAKLIVAEPTTMRKDIADDMKDNKDYTATMPDYMNAVYTATGLRFSRLPPIRDPDNGAGLRMIG